MPSIIGEHVETREGVIPAVRANYLQVFSLMHGSNRALLDPYGQKRKI